MITLDELENKFGIPETDLRLKAETQGPKILCLYQVKSIKKLPDY